MAETTMYPAVLEFDFGRDHDPVDRASVRAAARRLGLPIKTASGSRALSITVTSPKEAYEFGAYTQAEFQKRKSRS